MVVKRSRFEIKLARTLARKGISKHAAGWKGWMPPRHKRNMEKRNGTR